MSKAGTVGKFKQTHQYQEQFTELLVIFAERNLLQGFESAWPTISSKHASHVGVLLDQNVCRPSILVQSAF